jgi:hypothetical protein
MLHEDLEEGTKSHEENKCSITFVALRVYFVKLRVTEKRYYAARVTNTRQQGPVGLKIPLRCAPPADLCVHCASRQLIMSVVGTAPSAVKTKSYF